MPPTLSVSCLTLDLTSRSSLASASDGNRPLDGRGAMRDERRCDPTRGNDCPTEYSLGLRVSSIEETPQCADSYVRARPLHRQPIRRFYDSFRVRNNSNCVAVATTTAICKSASGSWTLTVQSALSGNGNPLRNLCRDAEWNRRHGPIPGGAAILRWRQQRDDASVPQHVTSADANIR
jgi:hypothetical protein